MARNYFVEMLPARRYYGKHATGWVLLVNGHPSHYPGRTGKRDARAGLEEFRAACKETGARVTVAKGGRHGE